MLDEYADVMIVDEVCKALRLNKKTVYELLKTGTIGSIRIGRKYIIPKKDVIKFLTNTQEYR